MSTQIPQEAETRSPMRPPLVSDRMVSASWALSELARVSAHRVNLQRQLEAVHEAKWSR